MKEVVPSVVFLLSCLTLITIVKGDYTVEPQNIAVLSGVQVTLSCVSDSSTTLDWRFEPSTGSRVTLVNDCVLNPSYSSNYRLVNTGPGQCDLQVILASSDQAGSYYCEAGFDPSVSSQLIVIASDPVCEASPSTGPIYEGMNVTYTCRATYTPDLIRMSMTWTNPQGQPVQGSLNHGSGSTTSSISVLAALPSLGSYRCLTVFNQPAGLPSTATNTPDYNHLWTSTSMTVTPKPDPIAPLNKAVAVGEVATLNCRRTTQKIAWTFVPAGSGSSTIVAVDCVVVGAVSGLYRVETTDGSCNLIVNSVTEQLAGTYTCQDTATTDRVVSAELIAIESDPVCSQSSTGPSIPTGTPVQFSCTFHYTGAIKPRMDWTDSSSNSVPPTTEHVNTTILQSTVTVTATSPVLSQYTCQTTFNAPTDVPPSHIDPATNVPEYVHRWSSVQVPVEGSPSGSDCSDILSNSPGSASGVYTLVVDGREIEVYCDMTTDGGGWTVIQRRRDGSQNFYRTYNDYESGFGNVDGEHWLGNSHISALTESDSFKLRIELGDFSNNYRTAVYSDFRVASSSSMYTLQSLGTYSGDAGNGMEFLTGHPFSTYDRDNDADNQRNCAEGYRGAWWYNSCSYSNLNGEYNNTNSYQGVVWFQWLGDTYSLRFSEMKIKPS